MLERSPIAIGEYSAVVVMPGVPGLLEKDGLCGWGWLGAAWVAAWALARLLARRQR
jgi:hypothetical protein